MAYIPNTSSSQWVAFMLKQVKKIEAGATPKEILQALSDNWDHLEGVNRYELRRWTQELTEMGDNWPVFYRHGAYHLPDGRIVPERRFRNERDPR